MRHGLAAVFGQTGDFVLSHRGREVEGVVQDPVDGDPLTLLPISLILFHTELSGRHSLRELRRDGGGITNWRWPATQEGVTANGSWVNNNAEGGVTDTRREEPVIPILSNEVHGKPGIHSA